MAFLGSYRSRLGLGRVRVLLTGIGHVSRNEKTGPMAQTFFLASGVRPDAAQRIGRDHSVCGDCVLRPILAVRRAGLACYVTVVQSVLSTWKAHRRARVQWPGSIDRPVRIGAYGDPASVPIAIIRRLVSLAPAWTAYTHQWRTAPGLRSICMASVDSPSDALEAQSRGWRTFRVRRVDSRGTPEPLLAGESVCPASAEYRADHPHKSPRVQCYTCGLCDGAREGREHVRSIAIIAHGAGSKTGKDPNVLREPGLSH